MWSIASLFGCGPGLVGSGPYDKSNGANVSGARYHLAKDLVVIDATISNSVSRSIADDLSVKAQVAKPESVEWAVNLKTVADPSEFYVLDLKPSGSKDQTLAIQIGESGLLTSINYTTVDKTGEIITNVAKSVASVAGAFVGFRAIAPAAVDDVFALTPLASDPRKAEARKLFGLLTNEALYFIKTTAAGKDLITEQILAQLDVRETKEKLDLALRAVLAAADEASAKEPIRKVGVWRDLLKAAEDKGSLKTAAFAAAMDTFLASEHLGKVTKIVKQSWSLELSQLPTSDLLKDKVTPSAVSQALVNFPRAKEVFEQSGVVVAYDTDAIVPGPAPAVPPAAPAPAVPAPAPAPVPAPVTTTDESKGPARIYYRDAHAAHLSIFATASIPESTLQAFTTQVRLAEERVLPVIDPRVPASSVAFEAKAFSNQNLQLTFTAQGRLTGVTQGATASLAGAASALANTVSAARDEFAATLTKAKEVQSTIQTIEANRLQARLDDLTKRKQIVDAKVALDASNANSEAKLEKLHLDQQIELATQQLAIAKLQGQQTQLNAAIPGVEQLKLEVELIKQRIEVLKQQAELNRLQQPPAPHQ